MDYKKKYEEAERLYRTANADQRYVLESLFPKLRESEDERTRKELITHCRNTRCVTEEGAEKIAKWLAWLEKQGEQKPATIDIDKMVDNYANNKELSNEEFGKPVPCMIRAYRQGLNDAIGKVVLKPAWNEEDEKEYKYVLKFVDNILNNCGNKKDYEHSKRCYDWLKSLRPQPKQEWSEEDQNALEDVREAIVHYWGGETQDILLYWLKSIKQKIKGE